SSRSVAVAYRAIDGRTCVALATVADLSDTRRGVPGAERLAARLAVRRAASAIGQQGTVEIRHRVSRPPFVHIRFNGVRRRLAVALSHRDGNAAAIAMPPGARARIGVD